MTISEKSPHLTAQYPRDMLGYANHPPHAQWPNQAKIAVQFVLNYEEGAENSIMNGDEGSETFLSEIINAKQIIGARNMNMESIYEYGSRRGFWRIHNEFEKRKLPLTIFGDDSEDEIKAFSL